MSKKVKNPRIKVLRRALQALGVLVKHIGEELDRLEAQEVQAVYEKIQKQKIPDLH